MKVMSKAAPAAFTHPAKAAVLAALAAIPDGEAASFDAIRATCKKSATALPDGVIHQIALDAGYQVEAV